MTALRAALWALRIAALCILAVVVVRTVHAHGHASWIMDSAVTRWCCGPTDCEPAKVGEIIGIDGVWLHVPTGSFLPMDSLAIYDSIDERVWRCVRYTTMLCLFLPP